MSYTPINWQTGDTITAEKMNKMDNGWGVGTIQLFSETVTTRDSGQGFATSNLSFTASDQPPEMLTVTFNGVDYQLQRIEIDDGVFGYGEVGQSGPDFTNYPFFLMIMLSDWAVLYTATAGTYTISATGSGIASSDNFKLAVMSTLDSPLPMLCVSGVTTVDEIEPAIYNTKRLLYFYDDEHRCFFISYLQMFSDTNGIVYFTPDDGIENQVSITDGIFTVITG